MKKINEIYFMENVCIFLKENYLKNMLVTIIIFSFVLFLYSIFELHYFIRLSLTSFIARYFKTNINVLDTAVTKSFCSTTDIDNFCYHMNNARYFREIDFARADFYERTNLFRTIIADGGEVLQGASTIRYRRFIRTFSCFLIYSRILYWDTNSIFMEHRFVTPEDQFVRAIAICRQRVLNCNVEEIMRKLQRKFVSTNCSNVANSNVNDEKFDCYFKPNLTEDIAKWIEFNEISSQNLRSEAI